MLRLEGVEAYYGDSHILKGLSFELKGGEVATLLGRNGAGKTTTLRTIMGLVPSRKGKITFDQKDITKLRPYRIASLGVGYVPEERAVFPSLSVLENLTLPASKTSHGLWSLDKIYGYFPVLKQRLDHRGSQLSGGEQQMLAIARVLTMDVKLVLLDEPTEGLAPFLVREIGRIIDEIRKAGVTILLVEQNTRFAMQVADRHHILYNGRIAWQGTTAEFAADADLQKRYLGV
ncbi:MAG: ABC transporter ATP-binding protein [Desulfomonile sp.]|nr:ABC transporter ATP-binding protein [Desulfomonile sp.]